MIAGLKIVGVAWALAFAIEYVARAAQSLLPASSVERTVVACVVVAVWGAVAIAAAVAVKSR